jgi:hypothetical protein
MTCLASWKALRLQGGEVISALTWRGLNARHLLRGGLAMAKVVGSRLTTTISNTVCLHFLYLLQRNILH